MKHAIKRSVLLILIIFLTFPMTVCAKSGADKQMLTIINERMSEAETMATDMAKSLAADKKTLPKSYEKGKLITSDSHWWCSGFFPGVLWYLYENHPTKELEKWAMDYTVRVKKEQYTTDNHDVGFIINCSYGNAYRLLRADSLKQVILRAAASLATRYNGKIGLFRSWDSESTQFKVIIDNMMNLELMAWSGLNGSHPEYLSMAESHADRTMKEHFRPDFSSYHMVVYDPQTGCSISHNTVQGYSDNSAWARGQSWGLYGYTMMYRLTKQKRYLQQAENIAHFLLTNPNMPTDMIPYWDYNDPKIPHTERDASAGAVMASALIELSQYTHHSKLSKSYLQAAVTALKTLSSPEYFAKRGSNGNFILKHSVGFKGAGVEVDVPLTYADYYYVEAMMRYKKIFGKK